MPAFLAAGAVPEFLTDICALLAAAATVAYVCHRLGLVPIVGFLIAGVAIGPNAFGLVQNQSVIEAVAEIGVLLLLFTIGIEFSLEKLARITRLILVGGGLQVVLVTGVVTAVLAGFGIDWRVGVFSGFLAALSSTAIVTKLLGDRAQTSSAEGQAALGVLIFQDLAVVVMVLVVPLLAGRGGSAPEMVWVLAKAALIIVLVLVVARRALPPLLEAVARTCSPDLFLLTVIAICIGTAWLVGMAGVSIALGAFLAGLVVSESPHGAHAFAEILPLQILFSATFFVSIGLLLDVQTMLANLPLVLLVASVVVAVKVLSTTLALRAARQSLPVSCGTALLVAQVGEFSFVLERSGREAGLTPLGMGEVGSQAFIAATVILMALTPLLATLASRLGKRLESSARARMEAEPPQTPAQVPTALRDHVIVAGYGRAARALVRVLRGSRIPFVIATLSPDGAREAEREGHTVRRGDYGKRHILELLAAPHAKLLVVPDDDPQMAHRVVAVARDLAPTTRIVARAATRDEAEALEHAGADRAIAAELEAIVGLFDDVLRNYAVAPELVLDHEAALRRRSFELFEPTLALLLPCELTGECFATRTLRIRRAMPIAGRTIDAASLAARGIRVRRIDAGGERTDDPDGGTVLAPGAEVTFAATAEDFDAAADLFRASDGRRGEPAAPAAAPAPVHRSAAWIDTTQTLVFAPNPAAGCEHLELIRPVRPRTQGCGDCLATGSRWVHLRVCMTCGEVGCCDSSPGKHAAAHYAATGHPVMRSLDPGETWGWCHVEQVTL
jgi:CPA2 family monovalent cation:H+ antiporter-2